MYVCLCNAVTDHEIRHAVRGGVLTFDELRLELGVACCCGQCHEHAEEVFHAALSERFPALPRRVILPDPLAA